MRQGRTTGEADRAQVARTDDGVRRFRKKPVVITAAQWFKNGDHPLDYAAPTEVFQSGEIRSVPGAERKARGWEGSVVRYCRRPDDNGQRPCERCERTMHDHGWLDTLEGGHIVCPGDWIITGIRGELYPCKPDIFEATYDPIVDAPEAK